jgi:hypothetical protein
MSLPTEEVGGAKIAGKTSDISKWFTLSSFCTKGILNADRSAKYLLCGRIRNS